MNTQGTAPAITRPAHPLVLAAAVAVIAASLTGIAYFAGWLPAAQTPVAAVASAPEVTTPAAPAAAPATPPTPGSVAAAESASSPRADKAPAVSHRRSSQAQAGDSTPHASRQAREDGALAGNAPAAGYPLPPVCPDCGTVESVRELQQEAQGSGLGAVAGGVLGGVLGHQVGNGRGRDVATVVGALGGAFAGNETEKNLRSARKYQITVRLEDGSARVFTQSQPPAWRSGDRVRIDNGQIMAY